MIVSTLDRAASKLFLAASAGTLELSPLSGVYLGKRMGVQEWNTTQQSCHPESWITKEKVVRFLPLIAPSSSM